MKVLFVSANTEQLNMPTIPWGMGCVVGATRRAGHDVRVVDLLVEPEPQQAVARAMAEHTPDVVGISVRNIDDQRCASPSFLLRKVKDVVDGCRAMGRAPIVLGGAGYSIFPALALAYLGADYGIQGEGEQAFVSLLEQLDRGEVPQDIPGLHAAGRPSELPPTAIVDLDDTPLPSPELLAAYDPHDERIWVPIQSRRGCAMRCAYCSTGLIEGRQLRMRSPSIVVDWMAAQVEAGFTRFFFVDNNFNVPPSYATALCHRITNVGVRAEWRCILHPARVDAGLCAAMARAGCRQVSLGFESGSERMLRWMNKHFTVADVRHCRGLLREHGIACFGFLLLGGPGETRESVEESLGVADELELDMGRLTAGIRIYPGTPLAEQARAEGVIVATDDLLEPRFYLAPELAEWLPARVADWLAEHPHWLG